MEPEIRYCEASDGVSIAYQVIGRGPAIVAVSAISTSHLSASWQWPQTRAMLEARAEDFTVVRYDGRGSGLSQREPVDFSLDSRLRDLEAVVARTQAGIFAISAWSSAVLVAIAYAARNPDRVAALVLRDGYASGRRWYEENPAAKFMMALREVTEEQWEFVTQAYASRTVGFADPERTAHFAQLMRTAMTPEAYLRLRDATREIDVTNLLKGVAAPTLVLHTEGGMTPLSFSQQLASGIAGARMVMTSRSGLTSDDQRVTKDFLLPALGPAASVAPELPQGTAIILFVDIVDSTALTERLGDAVFRAKARDVAAALRSIISENGGRTIEGPTLGDGVLATFTSARQAIGAALACGEAGAGAGMPLHLGLHAGDVIRESDPDGRANVYGGAVNIAARISGLSAPGEVLVSETVRSLARTSAGVAFEDRGEQALKGVGEAVRVWAVIGDDR